MIPFVVLALSVLQSHPELLDQTVKSDRYMTVGETPDQRVTPKPAIPAGPPPVLAFRYFEDKKHHRFDNLDVMLDDAGH